METECLTLWDLISPRKTKTNTDEDRGKSDQKENICLERRRMTPHKTEPSALNGGKVQTPELVHITPIKHPERSHPDPWTPTANLKMLISAASPDIRDREMKKILFRPIENEEKEEDVEDVEVDDQRQFDAVDDGDEFEKKPSRKQKSLGLLCQKFLALYPDFPPSPETIHISLDEVAMNLGVERRRIYDIVNVLESLMLVSRVAKNQYLWHGRLHLQQTLEELQLQGRQQCYHLHMEQSSPSAQGEGATAAAEETHSTFVAASRRKDKSLRIMSQKFVMLFLVSKTQTVTLDTAAKILIEEGQDAASHSKYKTKVRRLYDIANVLTSLALIKKVHVREERGRKPAFRWIGPAQFQPSSEASAAGAISPLPEVHADAQLAVQGGRREKLARHASFHVVPTSMAIQRRISSAPSTPLRELTGLLPEPVDYSRKSVSNSAVCRLQFGDSTGVQPSQRLSPGLGPLAVPVHRAEGPYGAPPPLSFPHHQLAYLPQASLLMLYGGRASPGSQPRERSLGKGRRKSEEEEEGQAAKRDRQDGSEPEGSEQSQCENVRRSPRSSLSLPRDQTPARPLRDGEVGIHGPSDVPPHSHYLYVPNSAGLNFLLPAGHAPGGVALPPGAMPTLALPYVLVPSSALSPYPLIANGDGHDSFNVPAMVSPTHFVMGARAFAVAGGSEYGGLTAVLPSPEQPRQYGPTAVLPSPEQPRQYGPTAVLPSPEQPRQYGPTAVLPSPEQPRAYGPVPPLSPMGPRQPVSLPQTEPHTPKEAAVVSKAFFQTPGTLGAAVAPPARRRASAQRRLDIGHSAN